MKKKVQIGLLLFVIFTSVACSKEEAADVNAIYIKKDGKVIETIVETLDQNYFDNEELEDWINSQVKAYNDENGKKKLEVKKCELGNGSASVTIQYATMEDYNAFNQVTAFSGTISEAQEAGFQLAGEFKSTMGKPSITQKELEGSMGYKVLILGESQKVKLTSPILYASDNVEVNEKKRETAIAHIESDKLAYVIYK